MMTDTLTVVRAPECDLPRCFDPADALYVKVDDEAGTVTGNLLCSEHGRSAIRDGYRTSAVN